MNSGLCSAMSTMAGCAAEDAEVSADAGGLVIDLAPWREFFFAEWQIAGENRLVLHRWYCGAGIGRAKSGCALLRRGRKW